MTNTEAPQRIAILRNKASEVDTIARYMPGNYEAIAIGGDVLVVGRDYAKWTMQDYVIPRLASGMHFAEELVSTRDTIGA